MSQQRLAVVTGAARGIGRAIVLELLKQGRKVAGIDLNAEQLAEMEQVAKDAGFSVITCCLDITQTDKLESTLLDLADQHGGIGILVNNAGITRDKLMIQMDDNDFDTVINVNLKAAFTATRVSARSMIRKPDILIFDEATNALDSISEASVQRAIDEVSKDHTVIVIAHRLSTIVNADKIIVLGEGRILEEGTHDELLARGGEYKKLYDMQFRDMEIPSEKIETEPQPFLSE